MIFSLDMMNMCCDAAHMVVSLTERTKTRLVARPIQALARNHITAQMREIGWIRIWWQKPFAPGN
jgi:hypothetical protein